MASKDQDGNCSVAVHRGPILEFLFPRFMVTRFKMKLIPE